MGFLILESVIRMNWDISKIYILNLVFVILYILFDWKNVLFFIYGKKNIVNMIFFMFLKFYREKFIIYFIYEEMFLI